MDVMTMLGDMADDLIAEAPMEGEMPTTMEAKETDHDHEGHSHADGEMMHYPMPESCLSKSFAIGSVEGLENVATFDNTAEILLRMTDHHHAHAL